ncbi:MAG: nitrogen fixation protein NifS, partial [Pseudomonadota bacterium]
PTVAMVLPEPGAEVASRLAGHGIMCGGGDFYGVRCLAAQGVDPDHGALRVSFTHYTATEEVEKLIAALERVL